MAMFTAIHNYTAQNQDEISFQIGQAIQVNEQVTGGWWQGVIVDGSRVSRKGWFPSNHVVPQSSQLLGDETAYRGFVVNQLMQFEQAYAETLAGFEHRHLHTLNDATWLSDYDKDVLLRPLSRLIKLQQLYHFQLDQQLHQAKKEDTCVGRVCLDHAIAMYWEHTQFAGVLAKAQARLQDLDRDNSHYQSYQETHPTPPSLSTALALPLSAAAKRSTLLKNLLQRTDREHPDQPHLKVAVSVYEQLAQACDAVHFMMQSQLMLQSAPIANWTGPSLMELAEPRLTAKVETGPLQLNGQFDLSTARSALLLLFDTRMVVVVETSSHTLEANVHYELFASKSLTDIKVVHASDNTLLISPNLPKGRAAQSAFFADIGSFGLVFDDHHTAVKWIQTIFGLQAGSLITKAPLTLDLNPSSLPSAPKTYVKAPSASSPGRRKSMGVRSPRTKHRHTRSVDESASPMSSSPLPGVVTEYDVVAAFATVPPVVPNRPVTAEQPSSSKQSKRTRKAAAKKSKTGNGHVEEEDIRAQLAALQKQMAELQQQLGTDTTFSL
eukprot:TRINITY_DN12348_c1_g1_i10.p1 TRINITY_DN12348_c1_g1~~TRINITY_DN12348_c1_g1_i10.p1  ORF type:complete len:559 (+),score=132.14 TRINITY_DN12348_c1_g1_i10:25-1677(+)